MQHKGRCVNAPLHRRVPLTASNFSKYLCLAQNILGVEIDFRSVDAETLQRVWRNLHNKLSTTIWKDEFILNIKYFVNKVSVVFQLTKNIKITLNSSCEGSIFQ